MAKVTKDYGTMEIKLSQELACVYQDPLSLVFLGLRKAYDTVDHGRIIRALEEYSVGPQMYELRVAFWAH